MRRDETILVYSDILLDDLCAIEYLSKIYKNIVIIVVNASDLPTSDYASDRVRSVRAVSMLLHKWFNSAIVHSGTSGYSFSQALLKSITRVYSLAPMTNIVNDLTRHPVLRGIPITLMAGAEHGENGAKNEWNAVADLKAYKEFFRLAKRYDQFTWFDCVDLYNRRGIPFVSVFQAEYDAKMHKLNESTANFDLQTVVGR